AVGWPAAGGQQPRERRPRRLAENLQPGCRSGAGQGSPRTNGAVGGLIAQADARLRMSADRLLAVYHVRSDAAAIEARAQAIAVEQSVEMPLAAIDAPAVLDGVVGRVDGITGLGGNLFKVRIALAVSTVGDDAAQLF